MPEEVVNEFLERNLVMKQAWEKYGRRVDRNQSKE